MQRSLRIPRAAWVQHRLHILRISHSSPSRGVHEENSSKVTPLQISPKWLKVHSMRLRRNGDIERRTPRRLVNGRASYLEWHHGFFFLMVEPESRWWLRGDEESGGVFIDVGVDVLIDMALQDVQLHNNKFPAKHKINDTYLLSHE